MKRLLAIIVLSFGFTVLIQIEASADYMSDAKCAELAGEANTDFAARKISRECGFQEAVLLSIMYDDDLKCAIKAGKAKTERAARKVWRSCY